MQLDVSPIIKALDGTPFKDGPHDLSLKLLIVSALFNVSDDKVMPGSEKIERNKIAEKVYAAEPLVELSLSEVGKIRNLLDGKNPFPVRVVAEALKMLEAAAK